MIDFPQSTQVNVKIPKKTFYENLSVSSADKRLFVEQLTSVYWRYKLTPENLRVNVGTVDEIEIFEIELSKKEFSKDILKIIDKGIPYHTLFITTFENEIQLWIAYKQKTQGDRLMPGTYYHSEWISSDEITLSLNGTSIDRIYENLFYQIAPEIEKVESESLSQSIAVYEQKEKIKKEITRLEKLAKKEKQPKKKFEIVQKLNKYKIEMEKKI